MFEGDEAAFEADGEGEEAVLEAEVEEGEAVEAAVAGGLAGPVDFGEQGEGGGVVLAGEVVVLKAVGAEVVDKLFVVGVGALVGFEVVEVPEHVVLGGVEVVGGAVGGGEVLEVVAERGVEKGDLVVEGDTDPEVEIFAEFEVGFEAGVLVEDRTRYGDGARPERHGERFGIDLAVVDVAGMEVGLDADWSHAGTIVEIADYVVVGAIDSSVGVVADEEVHLLEEGGLPPVVGVEEAEVLAVGGEDGVVAGGGDSGVGLAEELVVGSMGFGSGSMGVMNLGVRGLRCAVGGCGLKGMRLRGGVMSCGVGVMG